MATFTAIRLALGMLLLTARAAPGAGVMLCFVMPVLSGTGAQRELMGEVTHGIGNVLPMRSADRTAGDRLAVRDDRVDAGGVCR